MASKARRRRQYGVDYFSQLPEEITDIIFSYLTWKDLAKSQKVCHAWRRRALVTTAWKKMCIREEFVIPREIPVNQSSDGSDKLTYRELFFKLKHRQKKWKSQFVAETSLIQMTYFTQGIIPTTPPIPSYACHEFQASDKGLIAYHYAHFERDREIQIYDGLQQKHLSTLKIGRQVKTMALLDGILIVQLVNPDFVEVSSWDAITGELICPQFEGLEFGELSRVTRFHEAKFYDYSRELGVVAGTYTREPVVLGLPKTIMLWNVRTGKHLYEYDIQDLHHDPFPANIQIFAAPEFSSQKSFFVSWGNVHYANTEDGLKLAKLCSTSFKQMGTVYLVFNRLPNDPPLAFTKAVCITPYKGKFRILIWRLNKLVVPKVSELLGREVALEFGTSEGQRENCLKDGTFDFNDESELYRYVGRKMYLCSNRFSQGFSIKRDSLCLGSGKYYEILSWYKQAYLQYYQEFEIYKIDQQNKNRISISLSEQYPSCLAVRRNKFLVKPSWLDGLDGYNDSGIFLVAVGDAETDEDGIQKQIGFTRISWKGLKLERRADF